MKKIFKYEGIENLEKEIIKELDQVESKAKTRIFPRNKLHKLYDALSKTNYGAAEGNGGHVPLRYKYNAETTYIECSWYTWRKDKYISLSVFRSKANRVPRGEDSGILIYYDKGTAWQKVFPERYDTFQQICIQRALRGYPAPPADLKIVKVRKEENKEVVVCLTDNNQIYVVTPAGWFKAPKGTKFNRNAWLILKDIGFSVPRAKEKRKWNDELTAQAVLLILEKESE